MEVVYEDNHLIIVNKACGEIVQGDRTGDEPLVDVFGVLPVIIKPRSPSFAT